jgi:phosphatidylglycerophosphate synthase
MNHVREHRSLLAFPEERLLRTVATRLPPWVTSDGLSLLGLSAMAAAGFAFAHIGSARWSAPALTAALLINWFGDSLDGTVARIRNQERPRYGFYVDHVIDLVGTAALLIGMGASGQMRPMIAAAVLATYFLVSAETYLATHAAGVFRLSRAGVGPTELRILVAAGSFYVAGHPWVEIAGVPYRLLDVSGLVAAAGLISTFSASALLNARALFVAEPLPRRREQTLTPQGAAPKLSALNAFRQTSHDEKVASL